MGVDERELLFETYKLHAELAERVASLRESLNKLYSGMVATIVGASVLLHSLLPNTETIWALPILGIVVSLSWLFALHSITGRLSAKHQVLVSLEEKLPFNFLDRENKEFEKSRFFRRKHTGLLVPGAFLLICGLWLVTLLLQCR
ncbi:MAG: hypothetical protein OXC41_08095 [Gammaproteobacteria bacterium]|nr:hypothetical protein [Gammaproteobacteria bacterium]